MPYLFLQAVHFSYGYKARKAIVIHMAEGGGTVEWLRNPDNPNVSAHYVVRYSGAVVQMVSEKNTAWGANPRLLRTNNDSSFSFLGETIRYGYTAAKAALGAYWYDPNAAAITIEVEGYASAGPNAAQSAALKKLVAEIRGRWGKLPAIGHRDLQNYKPCPGKKIRWVDYGGHAVAASGSTPAPAPEEDMEQFKTYTEPRRVYIASGSWLYDNIELNSSAGNIQISPGRAMPYLGYQGTVGIVGYVPSSPTSTATKAYFISRDKIPPHVAYPTGASEEEIAAAVKAATTPLEATVAELNSKLAAAGEQVKSLTAQVAEVTAARDAAIVAKEAAEAAASKAVALKNALADFLAA